MTGAPEVQVCWVPGAGRSLGLPAYATDGAAGADLRAHLPNGPLTIDAGARALIPTGLTIAVPRGFEMQIRPRSGLALHHGITLANSPGTLDSDYRGEVGVIVLNTGAAAFEITHGMRVAQMVLAPVTRAAMTLVTALDATDRGAGGFGSTGRG